MGGTVPRPTPTVPRIARTAPDQMRGLAPLNCVLYSKQFPRVVRVTINPYFERHGSSSARRQPEFHAQLRYSVS
jgi:hypothetical protein